MGISSAIWPRAGLRERSRGTAGGRRAKRASPPPVPRKWKEPVAKRAMDVKNTMGSRPRAPGQQWTRRKRTQSETTPPRASPIAEREGEAQGGARAPTQPSEATDREQAPKKEPKQGKEKSMFDGLSLHFGKLNATGAGRTFRRAKSPRTEPRPEAEREARGGTGAGEPPPMRSSPPQFCAQPDGRA